jgi:hypothetical protein
MVITGKALPELFSLCVSAALRLCVKISPPLESMDNVRGRKKGRRLFQICAPVVPVFHHHLLGGLETKFKKYLNSTVS